MNSPTPDQIAALQKLCSEWDRFHAADSPGRDEDHEMRDSYGADILAMLEQSPCAEFFQAATANLSQWNKRDRWNARKLAEIFIASFSKPQTQT